MNSGQGILDESHHDVIEHNEIFDFYQAAIAVGYAFAQGSNGSAAAYPASHAHDDVVRDDLVHDIGRGVTNDMGGVYLLTCDNQNNVVRGNVTHDMVNDPGGNGFAAGYGANGLYFDQGTSNVAASDNLVYRVTGNAVQQNFGRANVVTNNILAFARNASIDRTFYEDPPTGHVREQRRRLRHGLALRRWLAVPAEPVDRLHGYAELHDNLYWNAATGGSVVFDPQNPAGHFTLAAWQSMEHEDIGSKIGDPKFVAPSPPTDNFTLKASSPAFAVGFVAFDPTKAGRTSKPIAPPSVPAAAPLQEPADPASFDDPAEAAQPFTAASAAS